MNKYFVRFDNGVLVHRPPIKVFVNTILRFIQRGSKKPLLLASICEIKDGEPIELIEYKFMRVPLNP